jgi:hypothetical protein
LWMPCRSGSWNAGMYGHVFCLKLGYLCNNSTVCRLLEYLPILMGSMALKHRAM